MVFVRLSVTMLVSLMAVVLLSNGASAQPDAHEKSVARKSNVTILIGRGSGHAEIIEPDGTVTKLGKEDLAFKNQATQRAIEASHQRTEAEAAYVEQRKAEQKKLKAQQAEQQEKDAEAEAAEAAKKAETEKNAEKAAAEQKAKEVKAYNDESYDYSGKPYVTPVLPNSNLIPGKAPGNAMPKPTGISGEQSAP